MMNSTDYSLNISDIGNDTLETLSDLDYAEEYQLNKSEFIVTHLGKNKIHQ